MKNSQCLELHPEPSLSPAKAVYVLTGCVGVIGANSMVLGPIAPAVASSIDAGVPTVMMAAAAFGLGTAASALFLARLIDLVGSARMLKFTMLLLGAALLLCAASPSVAVFIAAQLIAGMASGIALPAIYASAAAIAEPGRESRTIGKVLTGWTLSMIAGVSFSVVLTELFSWRAVYVSVSCLAALALIALVRLNMQDRPAAGIAPSPLSALGLPGIKSLLVVCGAFMTAFYGIYAYLGDHLHQDLGLPVTANGGVAIAYGAGFGCAALLSGMVDRFGPKRLMPLVLLVAAFVYLGLAMLGGSLVGVICLLFVLGLVNHLGVNLLIQRLTAIDPARRGTLMGLNSAVTYLAVFAGSSSYGPLYTEHGFTTISLLSLALMVIAVLTCLWRDFAGQGVKVVG
ncbi:MFS transporter [Enterobacter sp. Ap-916]|uniref:MFS transporter n=1 Tax=Enterobacteriaceae TaxID=543 RepID=UPI0014225098|nr:MULTISPECIES: MFS transporter [unclassified Enterobacter]NIF58060.1 MFS transporter [Enterobacter sp. Ap-867]NIG27998.1 MFS transporter [Enterobacter sp. Ap-916]